MREMPLPDVGLGAMILRRAALVPELPAISATTRPVNVRAA